MFRTFALSPRIADHATAFVGSEVVEPVTPRLAATVVLVRDGAEPAVGPEVFVMRRVASMAFAARMHVFPGGGVDPRDCAPQRWAGPPLSQWASQMEVDEPTAAGLVCAAVRELFEECGVLLAGAPGQEVVADLDDRSWEADRLALLDHSLALTDLLQRRGLELRTDLLTLWSHWCTPAFEPRRYDTWFFVAELPAGQRARDVGGEADRAGWLPARTAAAGGGDGSLAMMPPTVVTVEEVAAAADVASLHRARREIRLLMPWIVRSADGLVIRVDLDGLGGGEPGPSCGVEDVG